MPETAKQRIALASDHAGFALKAMLDAELRALIATLRDLAGGQGG